jgi:hypothetical protein
MMRSVIDHKKVLILALNGPGVGGGAAWFQGVADLVFAARGAWLQVPFNALGLVPENGSVVAFAQSVGVHRANEFLMFGRKMSVEELQEWGLVNTLFDAEGFHGKVVEYLEEQLRVNDGKSLLETKRLANQGLREGRMLAVYNAFDALAERSVDGASAARFAARRKGLDGEFSAMGWGLADCCARQVEVQVEALGGSWSIGAVREVVYCLGRNSKVHVERFNQNQSFNCSLPLNIRSERRQERTWTALNLTLK